MRRKPSPATVASSGACTIDLGARAIELRWRRSARRSCALQVDERGVRLAMPQSMSLTAMTAFVLRHRNWLLEHLQRFEDRARRASFELVDGAEIPFLGRSLRLRLHGDGGGPRWQLGEDGAEELCLDAGGDPQAWLDRALQQRALCHYRARVAFYCARLGLPAPPVRLSNARTRWGSCSARTGIRVHWRLIHLAPELIDYVIAHEVAHLREMNHSARFWAVVEGVYPQWRSARQRLREAGRALPQFVAAG